MKLICCDSNGVKVQRENEDGNKVQIGDLQFNLIDLVVIQVQKLSFPDSATSNLSQGTERTL